MEKVYALQIGDTPITAPPGFASCTGNNCGVNFIWNAIRFSIDLVIFVGIVLALIFLIFGGIKYITSGGDKQASASARGTITYALIGLLLLGMSFAILAIIQSLTGINLGIPGA